ncbi:hypothetical protein [Salinadaptatus halalkaliphilus]|uniref:hypothetical protein n=1 Tax=Salinadaptatus halalkaliphilus TaxID=2419781 RepID=UPI0015802437|nr:hypothetical protein [Salinadaptatus halalkaliphilus]
MASRPPIECPLCRSDLSSDQRLEDHLVVDHSKRKLAKFVVSETEALTKGDVA